MKGDSIVIEAHHRKAAAGIASALQPVLAAAGRHAVSIAGQSGSGKSETAAALRQQLRDRRIESVVLQQDDYFIHPPRTNDRTRRADPAWVGPKEVRLALMDSHVGVFLDGAAEFEKPLVDYEADSIANETLDVEAARVLIAEGTYTTLLGRCQTHVFIDRTYLQTREHRRKRMRDAAELDPFIDRVLEIEHGIISAHKARAHIVIDADYIAVPVG